MDLAFFSRNATKYVRPSLTKCSYTEKRVEKTMRGGEFMTNFDICMYVCMYDLYLNTNFDHHGNVMKKNFELLIYRLNQNSN